MAGGTSRRSFSKEARRDRQLLGNLLPVAVVVRRGRQPHADQPVSEVKDRLLRRGLVTPVAGVVRTRRVSRGQMPDVCNSPKMAVTTERPLSCPTSRVHERLHEYLLSIGEYYYLDKFILCTTYIAH